MVAAVGSLDGAPGGEEGIGRVACLFVHLAGETRAGTTDEADLAGGLGRSWGRWVLAFELGEGELFRRGCFGVSPGYGEGVRGPGAAEIPREFWEVDVHVAAGARVPFADEVDGDADGFTGEGFNFDTAFTADTEVVVEHVHAAHEDLETVEAEDEPHPWNLREAMSFEMDVQSDEGDEDANAVDVEEGLVEGVAERCPGLDTDEGKGASPDHSPSIGCFIAKAISNGLPAFTVNGVV